MLVLQGQSIDYIPPPKVLGHFTFGFNLVMADALWLRYIQDIDYCSRLFSDPAIMIAVDEFDELSGSVRCKRSWGFRMLDALTDLDPRFRMPHAVGGMNLSVLLNDFEGATIIFDKAVNRFPTDWAILYRAAYHYLFDLNDRERASETMLRAAENGGPYWLRFTAARLYSQEGQIEFGVKLLEDYLETLDNEVEREGVRSKIDEIKGSLVQ